MNIYRDAVKDLVLNPEFRRWVLNPNPESDKIWKNHVANNPTAVQDVEVARELLLELFSNRYPLQESEFNDIWNYIDARTEKEDNEVKNQKVIPIHHFNGEMRDETKRGDWIGLRWISRIAAFLIFAVGLGFLAVEFIQTEPVADQSVPIKYKEYSTSPGVKSSITLADGTKVLLNSGSLLRYRENFSPDKREVFLEGEAFFEVFHDPERPFTVKTGEVSTTALGTSFNIMAYEKENLLISLVTGKVAISTSNDKGQMILEPRETLRVQPEKGKFLKLGFDEDGVMGWTRKMIVFDNTELSAAIRTLENWYGVTFHFQNEPKPDLYLEGKFYNETLENVLDGLSYTAGLDFEIKNDRVNITFKH